MSAEPKLEIDLEAAGKQYGRVVFALDAPWNGRREIALPACVIAHGSGPTVTLWGANHGNEYEGPIVLGQLIRELDPAAVQGRLIILPAINPPALEVQARNSPVDGKNLNRIWPGDKAGTLSERVVAWLDDAVLSRAEVLMDLHSGGDLLNLIPMSMCHYTEQAEFRARIRAAQRAFNAPLSVELRLASNRATASGRAHDRGLLVVGSESGGGRAVNPQSLANGYFGLRNTLAHLEVLPEPPAPGRDRPTTRFTRKWGHEAEVTSDGPGVFVPFHELGAWVEEGQPAGQLFCLMDPRLPPRCLRFPASGLVAGRRERSGVEEGDVLFWVVQDLGER